MHVHSDDTLTVCPYPPGFGIQALHHSQPDLVRVTCPAQSSLCTTDNAASNSAKLLSIEKQSEE